MCEWIMNFTERCRNDQAEIARIDVLIEGAFERRRVVNSQREIRNPDGEIIVGDEHNSAIRNENHCSIETYRDEIRGSLQLRPEVRLRIEQRGMGEISEWHRERTRTAFAIMIENLEIERGRVENRINFRVALVAVAFAVLAVLLAGVSAICDMFSLILTAGRK